MTEHASPLSRRDFIQATLAGAALAAVPLAAAAQSAAAQKAEAPAAAPPAAPAAVAEPLPRRKLGKTGADVTILSMGGMTSAMSPQFIDQAWSLGIRYFDTAASYLRGRSEQQFAQFFAKYPERRKEMFLVTKCSNLPDVKTMLAQVDARLKACGTDYIDVLYIHGISPQFGGDIDSFEVPKSPVFKDVAEQLKKSGKAKAVGFTCHDSQLTRYLQVAAEGGFVDVIMMSYDPFDRPAEMEKAIDACHKAGIGLVAMKVSRAGGKVPVRLPELDKIGLTTRQGLLHAAWSDERLSAVCLGIDNLQQMDENTKAARLYKGPLKMAHVNVLREAVVASGRTLCPGCDGRCKEACGNPQLALNDIARLVSYYEMDGNEEAREWYRELAETQRNHAGADLASASRACLANLDFASIVKKADRYFA